ncbi:hypothetical protein PFISCL1PPCAC_11225, partial [Pristionchus fissidentatus]
LCSLLIIVSTARLLFSSHHSTTMNTTNSYKVAGHEVFLEPAELETSINIHHLIPEGFKTYQEQRNKKELIDTTILVGDKRIDAHRVLLSARIPFFKAMFCSSMVECQQPEINLNNQFCDFDADSIEQLIAYAYTGRLTITEQSVQLIMMAANFLHIDAVLDECANFLARRLKVCNAVSIHLFCRSINYTKIEEKVYNFLDKNFVAISETLEFHQLSAYNALAYLQRDSLHVDREEQVFAAICGWIDDDVTGERAKHMAKLLPAVRVSHLPVAYIEETMAKNAHVLADPACISLIDEAKSYHENAEHRCELNSFKAAARVCDSVNGLVFVVGHVPNTQQGDNASVTESAVEMYDPMTDSWTVCAPMPSARGRCGLALYDQTIYAMGGFDNKERLNTVQYYDVKDNKWTDMQAMLHKRSNFASVTIDGVVYVCGGYDGQGALALVEAFDVENVKGEWTPMAPMLKMRGAPAGCLLNGKIYVIGGHDGQQIWSDGECYDPATNNWEPIASMRHRRCRFGVTAMNGKIWAVGGYDGAAFLKAVESYDPATNTWTTHKLMERRRSRAALVVACGKLFAIGGFDGLNNLTSVVRYDEESDEWTEVAPMSQHSGGVSTIVLSIPATYTTPVCNF